MKVAAQSALMLAAQRAAALRRCMRGATIVEFALLAPAIFLILIGTIEGGRMLWTKQTLDEVAYSTARCMAVSGDCATGNAQRAYAVNRARNYGIALTANAVTPTAGADCRGFPNSSRIAIEAPVSSVLTGFVPAFPTTIRSEACFPQLL